MFSAMWCFVLVTCLTGIVHGYSGGAPVETCETMTPKHPATPQKSNMPYEVLVSSGKTTPGGTTKVTIKGKDGFKGFMLQARKGDEIVGKFLVSDDDKYVKTINCGTGEQNTATHRNSEVKNDLTLQWQAPEGFKDEVQFYVTVALDGGTYWVHKPTAKVQVN